MPGMTELIAWLGLAFLFALFGIVVIRVVTAGLRTRGLIAGTTAAGLQFVSASRVQLLIVSLVTAAQYLSQVWASPQRFPEIPQNWLLLFGGSQVLYLGSKFHGKRKQRFHI
jgi:hypothetical protein